MKDIWITLPKFPLWSIKYLSIHLAIFLLYLSFTMHSPKLYQEKMAKWQNLSTLYKYNAIFAHFIWRILLVSGVAVDWWISFLSKRSFSVMLEDASSSCAPLFCGVPQGSSLGPLLFTLYVVWKGLFASTTYNSKDKNIYEIFVYTIIWLTGVDKYLFHLDLQSVECGSVGMTTPRWKSPAGQLLSVWEVVVPTTEPLPCGIQLLMVEGAEQLRCRSLGLFLQPQLLLRGIKFWHVPVKESIQPDSFSPEGLIYLSLGL